MSNQPHEHGQRAERDELGRLRAKPPWIGLKHYSNKGKQCGPRVFKYYKIDRMLSRELRAQYEERLADPASTMKSLRAWLAANGVDVSLVAVSNHRHHWHEQFTAERRAIQTASAFLTLNRHAGPGAIAEAAHAKVEMMLMQVLFKAPGAPRIGAKRLAALIKMTGGNLANRRGVEQMRQEIAHAARQAETELRQAAGAHVTGKDVVRRMREILGV